MTWRRGPAAGSDEGRERVLVLGLGNPGTEYAHTRHNAGWDAVDVVARRLGTRVDRRERAALVGRTDRGGRRWILAKPLTYMNESGRAGAQLARSERVEPARTIVVHDDLDLPFGRLRLRQGGGTGGHNGLRSLEAAWRSRDFVRVRIGIGRPPAGEDPVDYVLTRPPEPERGGWDEVMGRAADAVVAVVEGGLTAAMDRFNAATPGPAGEAGRPPADRALG